MNKNIAIGIVAVLLILGIGYYISSMKEEKRDEGATEGTVSEMPVTSGENPEPGSAVHDLPVEPAAAAARRDLSAKLSVDERSIVILLIEEKTWNDGCLGLGKPNESCMLALVPGFRVEMLAKGKTYVYRTDKTGENARAETEF